MIFSDSHEAARDVGVVRHAITVSAGADETWRVVGGFADAGRFIGLPSTMTFGNGELGSVREVGEEVTEKMVAAGERFYAYVQTRGPMAAYGYHGCVAVEGDADESIIFYSIVYDASALSPAARAEEQSRLDDRFRGAIEAMADAVSAAAHRQ